MAGRKRAPHGQSGVTEAQRASVIGAMRVGLSFDKACRVNNLAPNSMRRERKRLPEFDADCIGAKSHLEQQCLDVIQASAIKQWQAAAWLLERCFGDRYKIHRKAETNNAPATVVINTRPMKGDNDTAGSNADSTRGGGGSDSGAD